MAFIPLALAFVAASRHRGTKVLIEGCALQIAGLTELALSHLLSMRRRRSCPRSP
ncbi:hypothetical protein [Bradyrhizobium sp. 199]|uniref:hypothetical protein n=1 Tax=Bradyrhizobium sp. 199 TaxID=2782664 RepID=UPI001FF71F15|nr:hypothetical protein [Bradyrhizobium sp. 199]